MKTKTTITVETYKFSAVRLRQDLSSSVCPRCGSDMTVGDPTTICVDQTAISESTLKESRAPKDTNNAKAIGPTA